MDREQILEMFEIITEIKETLSNLEKNPLLVTQEELDALKFNMDLFNDLFKNMRRD